MALTVFIALSAIGASVLACLFITLCRDANRRRTSSNRSSVHRMRS